MNTNSFTTRQSAQWGMYSPDQSYRYFLKSTKYVALTLEMAVVLNVLYILVRYHGNILKVIELWTAQD